MEIGDVFYEIKGSGRPYKCHVAGIIDGCMVVYKWYGRRKQWWHYEVKSIRSIEMFLVNRK
jgi:hypothetical protein